MTIRNSLALAALLVSGVAAQAQTQLPPGTVPQAGTQVPGQAGTAQVPGQPGTTQADAMTPYRAKEVIGTRVSLGATQSVGVVDDIVFSDEGQIEYLIVADAGKLVTVPWQAAKFDMKQKIAVLSITPQVYQTIPTYTVTTYPAFYTPTYRTETYRYYGLTPGQIRRTIRR